MAKQIENAVEEIVMELLRDRPELELVDVEYVKEGEWYLRVFIDKEGGIDLDDCQELSERLGKVLDDRNLIAERYMLEVSSPGLDRVLRKERDFTREMGKQVDVSFYAPMDGKKQMTGILSGYDGASLTLQGKESIPMEKISLVRLHIEF